MSAPAHEKSSLVDPVAPRSDDVAPPRRGTSGRMTETGLIVVKWSKWGKHRLYVNTADDRTVGWLDVDSGEPTLDMPELKPDFEAALQEARAIEETVGYVPRRTIADPVLDLAFRRPGEHLEQQIAAASEAGRELKPAQPDFPGRRAYSAMELGVLGERAVEIGARRGPAPLQRDRVDAVSGDQEESGLLAGPADRFRDGFAAARIGKVDERNGRHDGPRLDLDRRDKIMGVGTAWELPF